MTLINDLINKRIFTPPPPPRDEWVLGEAQGAPSGGIVSVLLDGDTIAVQMSTAVTTAANDRVLTCLLGRSRICVANLTSPAGGMTAAQILAALLTVDGTGSLLDADKLDGQEGSYYLPASSYSASDVLTKIKTVDGASSGLDADLLDGSEGASYLLTSGLLTAILAVDGASSGIDADKLDGVEGAGYAAFIDNADDWSPTITANGSMTVSAVSIDKARHWHIGGVVFIDLKFDCTLGGTASNGVRFTLPHAAAADQWLAFHGDYFVSNHYVTNSVQVSGSTTTMQILRADSTTDYVTGSGRNFCVMGFYKPS